MHQNYIQKITDLPWQEYDPLAITFASYFAALEFAESLRCALEAYPEDENLIEMAHGELNTENLNYKNF